MRVSTDPDDAMQYSTRHLYSNTFLRMKDITLSYTLPNQIVKKVGLGSARVYFSGINLLTFAAHKNYDPEVDVYASTGWNLPISKTYTFGIDISF